MRVPVHLPLAASLLAVVPADVRANETRTVRLAVTAQVAGEVSTCGCSSGPQGGLARRSARLASWRAEDPELVLLDAGGYASNDPVVGRVITDSLTVYMSREGYRAVAVGEEELAAGYPFLDDPRRRALERAPHVSANLFRDRGEGPVPLAQPFVQIDVRDVAVGVTSVVSPELVGRIDDQPADLVVLDPADAARRVRDDMARAGVELFVLLAHLPESDAAALGRSVPGYDVIVIGHRPRARVTHGVDGGTVYVYPGDRGRYLADVQLVIDEHGLARVAGGAFGIELDDPVDMGAQRFVQRALSAADGARRAFLIDKVPRGDDARFAGAAACGTCHEREHASWLETPHARAFDTLVTAGMDGAEDCIRCHVTGFGLAPIDGEGVEPDLRGVQCETCHTVDPDHASGGAVPRVEPVLCRRCHDAENSREYDPARYWPLILHEAAHDGAGVRARGHEAEASTGGKDAGATP